MRARQNLVHECARAVSNNVTQALHTTMPGKFAERREWRYSKTDGFDFVSFIGTMTKYSEGNEALSPI